MQECWEAGDISPIQHRFTADAWNRFNTQLQNKNVLGEVTHVWNIHVLWVGLADCGSKLNLDYITVQIKADYNVWTTDRDGKCIMGSPNTRHRMTFLWTLERDKNAKTVPGPQDTHHCPNCGAELDLNAFAECPYCHAAVEKPAQDWVISSIQGVSQKTISK